MLSTRIFVEYSQEEHGTGLVKFDNSLVGKFLLSSGMIDIVPISSPTAINSPLDCKDNDCISTLLSSSVMTYLLSA